MGLFVDEEHSELKVGRIISTAVLAIVSLILVFSSWFITPEGHMDVVKRFGEAKYVTHPGLNWKVPMADTTNTIEIRTRKNQEQMATATAEQMPAVVTASMNWTVQKDRVLDLFKEYGSLSQFEDRVIDPKFRSIVKETVAKFTAEQTIKNRDLVTTKAVDAVQEAFKGLPIQVSTINIENITLPKKYLESIETKQTEKNLADAEKHKLARQKLESMRAVNTADAAKQAAMQVADGKAYATITEAKANAQAIKLVGEAEAKKIQAITRAMKSNPQYVDLVKAKNWNGALPKMVTSPSSSYLLNMGNPLGK